MIHLMTGARFPSRTGTAAAMTLDALFLPEEAPPRGATPTRALEAPAARASQTQPASRAPAAAYGSRSPRLTWPASSVDSCRVGAQQPLGSRASQTRPAPGGAGPRAAAWRRRPALAGRGNRSIASPELGDPLVLDAHGGQHRRRPGVARAPGRPWPAGRGPGRWDAVPVGLVDHEEVADLEDPGLGRLDASPVPGASSTTVASATARPRPRTGRPRRSRAARRPTRGVEDPQRLGRSHRQPAEMAAGGHRADVDLGVESVLLHPHPVAQQRAAGERRAGVDRQHADPLARGAAGADQGGGDRRLADPGRPGEPDHVGAAGVRSEVAP